MFIPVHFSFLIIFNLSNLRNTCRYNLSTLNIFKAALKELNQVQESLVVDDPASKGLVQEYYDLTTEEQEIINCPEKKIIPCFAGALQSSNTLTFADSSILFVHKLWL